LTILAYADEEYEKKMSSEQKYFNKFEI